MDSEAEERAYAHGCPVISAEDQLANKRAAGRPKDSPGQLPVY